MIKIAKHIVIITGQHMVSNPRVWKEANTLASNGYKVTILTTFYDKRKKEQDKQLLHHSIVYKAAINLINGEGTLADVFFGRLCRIASKYVKMIFKIDTAYLLVYRPIKQLKLAIAEHADLYIAHQETGLIIGDQLLKKGEKVAFDFEDWYSRDYVNQLRPIELLRKAETFVFQNAVFYTCPSHSMEAALKNIYKPVNIIEVIYNGFSINESERIALEKKSKFSLVWFSQVIGPGRGLETLMNALLFLPYPVEVHLAGDYADSFAEDLKKRLIGTNHSLIFHSSMKHHELIHFLSGFNIALALENNFPDSRDTTITNKILQYLQSGNKIIATNTKGQMEVAASFPDSVSIVEVNQPEIWARSINKLIGQTHHRSQEQVKVFNKIYSWEAQEEKLLQIVANAINLP